MILIFLLPYFYNSDFFTVFVNTRLNQIHFDDFRFVLKTHYVEACTLLVTVFSVAIAIFVLYVEDFVAGSITKATKPISAGGCGLFRRTTLSI